MKKREKKRKNVLNLIFVTLGIIMILGSLIDGAVAASIFFLLFTVMLLPVNAIQKLWDKIPRGRLLVKCVTAVLIFFIGASLLPTTTPSETQPDSSSEITAESTLEESEEEPLVVETTDQNEEIWDATPVTVSEIPSYSGSQFTYLNNGEPSFSAEQKATVTSFEKYSELDSKGRVGTATACLSTDTMPKDGEERSSISSIHPTGWVQAKYDFISGKYLYNRSHLIGWQLSAENANTKNLITGTKSFNVDGMLPFENLVADYIHETGNHVLYRVTPVFDGDNLLANGVQIEAWSVEDSGDGVCFNVFVYNVQQGVALDYATGQSQSDGSMEPSQQTSASTSTDNSSQQTSDTTAQQPATGSSGSGGSGNSVTVPDHNETGEDLVWVPVNGGTKYHSNPSCSNMKNPKQVTRETAIANGYEPCKRCY